eukprot:1151921-Pelagomonas_calceolata.AAC.2
MQCLAWYDTQETQIPTSVQNAQHAPVYSDQPGKVHKYSRSTTLCLETRLACTVDAMHSSAAWSSPTGPALLTSLCLLCAWRDVQVQQVLHPTSHSTPFLTWSPPSS